MSAYVDLHLHTNCSDGSDPPAVVVERAAQLGFAAMAITDHDTVAGLAEAEAAARAHELAFVTGVEISTTFGEGELHVVGLGIRIDDASLFEALAKLQEERRARARAMIHRLNQLGVPIEMGRVQARADCESIGRLHIAQELLALGATKTVQQAFDKYIGKGRSAFAAKTSLPCTEAIELIHGAGGLAFLAHPGIGLTSDTRLTRLLHLPFDGIEAYHSKHSPGQTDAFAQLAEERGLLIVGGSDCHGTTKNAQSELGKVHVPYRHFERLLETLAAAG